MPNCPTCLTPSCNPRVLGECTFYTGPNIVGPSIVTGDTFNTVVQKLATAGGGISSASNGLTSTSNTVMLGQDLNASGNPALLSGIRQIPFDETGLSYLYMNYRNVPLAGTVFQPGYIEIVGNSGFTTPILPKIQISDTPTASTSKWEVSPASTDITTTAGGGGSATITMLHDTEGRIILTSSNSGIGDPVVTIQGFLQIEDSTEGVGKILTSDATGKASWVDPIAVLVANGVSNTNAVIALGQDVNEVSNPAGLTNNREIPLNARFICLTGTGQFIIGANTSNSATNKLQVVGDTYLGGSVGVGITNPSARLHLAGSLASGDPPLKLTSSAYTLTPQTGAIEYNGNNLAFTRTGSTRENIFTGNAGASAPSTVAAGSVTNRYGGATNFLGDPVSWAEVVISGVTYKIPLYT